MGEQNSCAPLWRLLVSGRSCTRKEQPDCVSVEQTLQASKMMKRLPDSNVRPFFSFVANSHAPSGLDNVMSPPHAVSWNRTATRSPHAADARVETTAKKTENAEKELSVNIDEVDDAEFAACVLNALPKSYDDFEAKDMNMKLDRNVSSPLVTCQSPAVDSGRVSAGSNFTKSSIMHFGDTGSPLDAEDLEVAMINESFEEQQKQNQMYASPELKDLFYSQPNAWTHSCDYRSAANECRNAVQGANVQKEGELRDFAVLPDLEFETPFSPSDAVFAFNPSSIFDTSSSRISFSQVSHSAKNLIAPEDEPLMKSEKIVREAVTPGGNVFDVKQHCRERSIVTALAVEDLSRRASNEAYDRPFTDESNTLSFSRRQPMQQAEINLHTAAMSDDKMEDTRALAYNIIESLFDNGNTTDSNKQLDVKSESGESKIGKVEESRTRKSVKERLENQQAQMAKMTEQAEEKQCRTTPEVMDSWEDFDSETIDAKGLEIEAALSKVKLEKSKEIARAKASLAAIEKWNDDLLPHVLEAYGVPEHYTNDDVMRALAEQDCADVALHRVEGPYCLVVFSSASAALHARISQKSGSGGFVRRIQLRSLREASEVSREKALKEMNYLKPHQARPLTTPLIARRLVEQALGKRSTVSKKQIESEKAVVARAKEAKRMKDAIWGDKP